MGVFATRRATAALVLLGLAACGEPEDFQQVLDRGVADGLPGVTMQIRHGDRTWTGAAGFSDIVAGTPMRPDDRFLAIGATEPWLAVAVLQLVGDGEMSLDDGLATIVGLQTLYQVPDAQRMTVAQALGQSTGLHNPFELLGFLNDVIGPGVDPARMRAPMAQLEFFNMRGYRPVAAPGDATSYSAANATLLGMVLETVAGQPLNELMASRVFDPAGVEAGFASFGGPLPTVHNYVDLRDTLVDVGPGPMAVPGREFVYDLSAIDPSWAWATGVCLDVAALARLMDQMVAWMTDGADATGPMMGPHGPEVMVAHGGAVRFGLGQMQRETPAGPAIGYDGQALGYAALVYAVPDADLTVAILANGSGRDVNLPQMFARVVALVAERGEGLF